MKLKVIAILGAIVAFGTLTAMAVSHQDQSDQCTKPAIERVGGWACPGSTDSGLPHS
jgi:predicted outer membrane lipoprotein